MRDGEAWNFSCSWHRAPLIDFDKVINHPKEYP
jgi:hypothetical protein